MGSDFDRIAITYFMEFDDEGVKILMQWVKKFIL